MRYTIYNEYIPLVYDNEKYKHLNLKDIVQLLNEQNKTINQLLELIKNED